MYDIAQLEKQQVGIRLPKYLVEETDELAALYSLNRTDIIAEAIRSYVADQKAKLLYDRFDRSVKEAKAIQAGKAPKTTLGGLIDELRANCDA
ncbi:MAG: ribbon-helix-helix domain-containing protein [Campylobacterales bacterium]